MHSDLHVNKKVQLRENHWSSIEILNNSLNSNVVNITTQHIYSVENRSKNVEIFNADPISF